MASRRISLRPLTTTVILLSLVLVFNLSNAQEVPVFRIGVLDNFDGPITEGAQLAVQQINNAGGVQGADGTVYRLELSVQPTGNGANLGDSIAALGQTGVIAVLGPASGEEVQNGLPILQVLNVPILTPAAGDTIIAADTTGKLFRTRAPELTQGRALADYLIRQLAVSTIATVQLDTASTAGVIGFSSAATSLGITPAPALLLEGGPDVTTLVTAVIQANPGAVVTYGNPAIAGTLYTNLRVAGWQGIFVYENADDRVFRNNVPRTQLRGIISKTTWPYAATDAASANFLVTYVRAFGKIPGAVEASSYDAVFLLAQAIQLPGELVTNLAGLDNATRVQGPVRPVQLPRGELSDNVAIVRLGEFGASEVVARYAAGQILPADQLAGGGIPALPTATPDGVVITITGSRQNVRTGPGTEYDVLGQLSEGEQIQVIGASLDQQWVVVNFRQQNGWLATYLLDVFGNLNTVPVIPQPPTPTPGVTPTLAGTAIPTLPAAQAEADVVILSAVQTPNPILINQPFTVTVTITNRGSTDAGPFAIAATFPPNNVYSSVNVPGLPRGQTITATMTPITLSTAGSYSVVLVTDLNQQVIEGAGEANNNFTFSYIVQ